MIRTCCIARWFLISISAFPRVVLTVTQYSLCGDSKRWLTAAVLSVRKLVRNVVAVQNKGCLDSLLPYLR